MILTKPKPIQYHKRPTTPPPPTPQPPVLVAATYEDSDSVTLTFDRAIDLADVDAAEVFVDDEQISGRAFQGAGATAVGATGVRFALNEMGPATGSGIALDVGPGANIAAADGGARWAGVAGLALPFPS